MVGPAAATLSKGSAPALRKSLCFYFFYFFCVPFLSQGRCLGGTGGAEGRREVTDPRGTEQMQCNCVRSRRLRQEGGMGGRMDGRKDGWMSVAPQPRQPAGSGAGGVCIRTGHPLRLQVPPAPRFALVPHGHRFTLDIVYTRSAAPGVPARLAAAQGRGVPALCFSGGSVAQGASENLKEIPRKLVFSLACCADGLTHSLNSFPTWHQGKVSSR